MADPTEKIIDTAADVAGEVKDNAEALEQAIRALNQMKVKYFAMGVAIGGVTGAVVAFKIAYVRAQTKYSKISDEEIDEMRQHYREKMQAAESSAAKRPLEEIIKERGYSSPDAEIDSAPMAIQPPAKVLDNDEDEDDRQETRIEDEPMAEAEAEEIAHNIFQDTSRDANEGWDWHEERRKRSPDRPYVIHYDERHEIEGYSDMTLTYYEKDDVVADERDEIQDPDERDELIGVENLNHFGHGSGDTDIVFVRNDKLQILYEINRTDKAYGEVVHGFRHEELSYGNLERMRRREIEDESEE